MANTIVISKFCLRAIKDFLNNDLINNNYYNGYNSKKIIILNVVEFYGINIIFFILFDYPKIGK